MTVTKLAIAAMENHRLAYFMMTRSVDAAEWEYWAEVQRKAARKVNAYLSALLFPLGRPLK